jgi:hypothetical protein
MAYTGEKDYPVEDFNTSNKKVLKLTWFLFGSGLSR